MSQTHRPYEKLYCRLKLKVKAMHSLVSLCGTPYQGRLICNISRPFVIYVTKCIHFVTHISLRNLKASPRLECVSLSTAATVVGEQSHCLPTAYSIDLRNQTLSDWVCPGICDSQSVYPFTVLRRFQWPTTHSCTPGRPVVRSQDFRMTSWRANH